MPQMSPLWWCYIFTFFVITLSMTLNSLPTYQESSKKASSNKKNLFKNKW